MLRRARHATVGAHRGSAQLRGRARSHAGGRQRRATLSLVLGRRLRNANITATADDLTIRGRWQSRSKACTSQQATTSGAYSNAPTKPPAWPQTTAPTRSHHGTCSTCSRNAERTASRIARSSDATGSGRRLSTRRSGPCRDLPSLFNPSLHAPRAAPPTHPSRAGSQQPTRLHRAVSGWERRRLHEHRRISRAARGPKSPVRDRATRRSYIRRPPRHRLAMRPTISPRAQPSIG